MKKLPKKVFCAALAVSLCLTGCTQPLEGIIGGKKPAPAAVTVPGTPSPPPIAVPPSAGDLSIHTLNGVSVPFRYVPAGSFQRDGNSANISVITRGCWMGETEVTQELFWTVMGTNPSYFDGSSGGSPYSKSTPVGEAQHKRPVEQVNWYDAIAFCNKLSLANGKEPVYSVSGVGDWAGLAYGAIPTGDNAAWNAAVMDAGKNGYRLPTEMEWMWAAMGADKTAQPNTTGYSKALAGSTGSNSVDDYAWYYYSSGSKTHEAGKKQANELGLKDMSGNGWEWCWDRWGSSIPAGTQTDYTGAASGTYRVVRGGSWNHDASSCAVSYRSYGPNYRSSALGFRVACP
jgi:formylglycine-generating enzyme required for sulfatase activity